MKGLGRCFLCKDERDYESVGPGLRCGGCGARGSVKLRRAALEAPVKPPPRPSVPELMSQFEEALARAGRVVHG